MAKTTADTTPSKRAKVLRLPARRATPALAAAPTEADGSVQRKYARLYRKYMDTVQAMWSTPNRRLAALEQGWWALERTGAGLALVRGRKLTVCNARFRELGHCTVRAGWLRLDPTSADAETKPAPLHTLIMREAAAIYESGVSVATRRYKLADGDEYIEASYHCSATDADPADVAVLVQDATARVRAEHELDRLRESLVQQERLRAIGELASGVAHDLNNTLHAMSLRLSLVEQSPACLLEQGDNIRALSRIVADAALVVGRLQDFARQRDRPLESVDVAAIVGEAIEIVRTGIEGQSSLDGAPIRIRNELPPLPPVPGLASDLRHVMVNLLLNARDAMPQGGTIRIVGEHRGKRVILKVIDQGRGIAEPDLAKIFDPFFTTKGERGTGLGLSMARGVLLRVGGEIAAHNEPSGGACFTLSFPVTPGNHRPVVARPSSAPPPGRHILIIDDDIENLEATKMAMEREGQVVDIAQTGREALEWLRAGMRYDLVLCDLGMPDMNGWRVAREIQDVAPGTTVYMLTGWAQQIAERDPRRKWVKGILEKPMKMEHLRDLLALELAYDAVARD